MLCDLRGIFVEVGTQVFLDAVRDSPTSPLMMFESEKLARENHSIEVPIIFSGQPFLTRKLLLKTDH